MEPRSNPVLEPPGTRLPLCSPDGQPYSPMRPCTPLRRFAFPARGRLPQPRGPPAQRATPRPLPRIIHQPQPSPTHNGCGLSVLEWAAAELGYLERPAGKRAEKKKDFAGLFCGHWPKNLVHAVPQCVQPFPIAVSTRAGTEAAARSKKRNLSALTEANPTSTPFWLLTAFEPMTAPPEAACCQGWVRGSLRAVASHVFGCGTHDI